MPDKQKQNLEHNWYRNEKPGWHEYTIDFKFINVNSLSSYVEHYQQLSEWIINNIEKATRHARWTINETNIIVRFRYERDYIRFILRWS